MSYQVPPRFAHGDQTVSAANFNKYSDALNALNSALIGVHFAVGQAASGETLAFVNLWRWLHYQTLDGETGTLSDPSGAGADVTLSSSDSAMSVYDLANVDWLTQGQVYTLTGVEYACEDWEA